jgi:hypothetical protein
LNVGVVGWILGRPLLGVRILDRAVPRAWRHIADHYNGVRARYLDLTLTETGVRGGRGKTATYFPLTDLVANLEESFDNSGWLTIDGPGFQLRRQVRYRPDGRADVRAQRFVDMFNYYAGPHSVRAASAWMDAHGIRWSPPGGPRRWNNRLRTRRCSR